MYIKSINSFDPDLIPSPVVGVVSKVYFHNSGYHQHNKHQFLFAKGGGLIVEIDNSRYFVPPSCAIWVPAKTTHKTTTHNEVELRSLFFEDGLSLPSNPLIIGFSSLLFELADRMAHWPWDKPISEQHSTLTVFQEELQAALLHPLNITMPKDRRLNPLLDLLKSEQNPPKLIDIEKLIGASSKTIGRIFIRETGLSYQAWRQQWRLMKAMEMLTDREPVHRIAEQLEFSSSSAFIAFFQKHTNQTPGKFVS
ncbi:helix-turn-helix domain-containing protein [Photobacterium sp. J15]|uniref:helix-turn-helix domain-containing protein n=1 Tax=Photobacterium sp. J15 TaxID=265901 RepID=UPI0007E4902E|nr:AraC family transcriptional regulator [Photobacterium sp. J15]